METVKVDIQKLQLLNDRIAQMIDALNQVRMSVHGIQHTPAQVAQWGYGAGYGGYPTPSYGFAQPFTPYASPYGMSPFATSPYVAPLLGGIQHTSTPYPTTPFPTPFGIQHTTPATSLASWSMPYVGNGISHTAWDPSWQMRGAQWFPFAQSPYPVTIS